MLPITSLIYETTYRNIYFEGQIEQVCHLFGNNYYV